MEGLSDEGSAQCWGHLQENTNMNDDTHQPRILCGLLINLILQDLRQNANVENISQFKEFAKIYEVALI